MSLSGPESGELAGGVSWSGGADVGAVGTIEVELAVRVACHFDGSAVDEGVVAIAAEVCAGDISGAAVLPGMMVMYVAMAPVAAWYAALAAVSNHDGPALGRAPFPGSAA
jgi:hypothetical protein